MAIIRNNSNKEDTITISLAEYNGLLFMKNKLKIIEGSQYSQWNYYRALRNY